MTAEQLKNSILQMAVQGKLVPQDPNDEPASKLIERIREEKQKLIKEGKIKKEKNPSYIFRGEDNIPYEKVGNNEPVSIADEVPFEIPESWEWVRLINIYNFIDYRGKTPTKLSSGIPLVTAKNVKNGYVDYSIKDFISTEEFETRQSRGISRKGDILFTTEAPMGNAALADLEIYSAGQRLITFQQYTKAELLSNELMMYFIMSFAFKEQLKANCTGTTVKGIKADKLKNFYIPVPPSSEQNRIVKMIKKLFPLIHKYDKSYAAVSNLNHIFPEQLKKSILQEAVMGKLVSQDENDEPASVLLEHIRKEKQRLIAKGKLKKDKHESIIYSRDNSHYEKLDGVERCIDKEIPFEIPDSWEWCHIGNIAFVTKLAGFEYTKNIAPNLVSEGIPLFKGKNVQNGQLIYEFEGYIPEALSDELERSQINKKCLLTPYVGTIGNIAIFPGDFKAHLGSNVGKIEIIKNLVLEEYVMYYFRSDLGYKELTKHKKATAQESISIEAIRDAYIPIPPFAEQKRIIKKIELLFSACINL